MRVRLAFIAGAGLGYVLGTRAGRQQFEKIQGWSRSVWADPRVQAQVTDLEAKATEFARTEGAVLKEKATGAVKSVVDSIQDRDSGKGDEALGGEDFTLDNHALAGDHTFPAGDSPLDNGTKRDKSSDPA